MKWFVRLSSLTCTSTALRFSRRSPRPWNGSDTLAIADAKGHVQLYRLNEESASFAFPVRCPAWNLTQRLPHRVDYRRRRGSIVPTSLPSASPSNGQLAEAQHQSLSIEGRPVHSAGLTGSCPAAPPRLWSRFRTARSAPWAANRVSRSPQAGMLTTSSPGSPRSTVGSRAQSGREVTT